MPQFGLTNYASNIQLH